MITNQEIEAGAEALYMAFPTLHEDFTPVGCPGGGLPRMADYAMALACVDEVLGTEGLDTTGSSRTARRPTRSTTRSSPP
jgi:hypothetical protein